MRWSRSPRKSCSKPIKWIADRTDHFVGDAQGRDNVTTAKMALAEDGKFLAIDVDMIGDMGAYLSTFAPYIPYGGAGMLPGLYDFPAFHCRVRAAFTNTVPVDAYRGAGPPGGGLCDRAAGRCRGAQARHGAGCAAAQEFHQAEGDAVQDRDRQGLRLRRFRRAHGAREGSRRLGGFPKRAKAAKKAGLLRGIGLATYIEACGTMGAETATVALDPNGGVTVLIGSQSSGQGHQTAYAQLVAEQFGLPPERVHVLQGDTDTIATGLGTGGSARSRPAASASSARPAISATSSRSSRPKRWKPAPATSRSATAAMRIAGTDRSISFADLAKRPGVDPSKLNASATFAQADGTYPNGTHLAEVEIDPATGTIKIVNYVIVDDFGVTLNPLLLAGQVHGGAVQGIGQALMEQAVYSATDGQLVTGTFMDYALPRAADGPSFHFETHNVPCTTNPLGVKGAGEAGAIGSCPAVINAIVEGLWREYKIDHIDMPATAERVWIAIREAQRRHNADILPQAGMNIGYGVGRDGRLRGGAGHGRGSSKKGSWPNETSFGGRRSAAAECRRWRGAAGAGQEGPGRDEGEPARALAACCRPMVKGEKPYDQAAVDKALAELDDTAKKLPSLFPESIKGLKPAKATTALAKVWEDKAGFDAKIGVLREGCPRPRPRSRTSIRLKAEFPPISKECGGCHETFRVKS